MTSTLSPSAARGQSDAGQYCLRPNYRNVAAALCIPGGRSGLKGLMPPIRHCYGILRKSLMAFGMIANASSGPYLHVTFSAKYLLLLALFPLV